MIYHIYCDESRQTKDRYMVLGGIVMPASSIGKFNSTMSAYRVQSNMMAELKWTKVSDQKIKEYKSFVEYFFALNNTDQLHFHSIIIDTHQLNHKKHSDGNKENSFYKFFYQLLLHCFGKAYCEKGSETKFILHMDQRTSSYKLDDLKTILNRGMFKEFGISNDPFVSIEPKNSKQSEVIQINDLIIGAIGYYKNGYHLLAGSKKSKMEMVNYITSKSGLRNIGDNTAFRNRRFTMWNLKFKK